MNNIYIQYIYKYITNMNFFINAHTHIYIYIYIEREREDSCCGESYPSLWWGDLTHQQRCSRCILQSTRQNSLLGF